MNWQPYTIARYGVYAALVIAAASAWLGQRAGASLDYALMRSVFVFLIFTALAFGAEALLSFSPLRLPEPPRTEPAKDESHDD